MLDLDRPRDRDTHTVADYAELLCLTNLDRISSRESIRDRMRDVGDTDIDDDALEDLFGQLAWRSAAFDAAYPFTVPGGRTLRAPEALSERQQLYVLLLLCANIPFVRHSTQALTASFERVALHAIRCLWPSGGVVRPFGSKSADYVGAKWERINLLAVDIGGQGACTTGTFREGDSGDGGIDLMAALPLDPDEQRNIPSLLGQCACSRDDWVRKQSEISVVRLGNQIHATHPWIEALFIPQSFRDSRGRWAVDGDVGRVVLFDRLRIVRSIGAAVDWASLGRPIELQSFLDERLPLV